MKRPVCGGFLRIVLVCLFAWGHEGIPAGIGLNEQLCKEDLYTRSDFEAFARSWDCWTEVGGFYPLNDSLPFQGPLFVSASLGDHELALQNCMPGVAWDLYGLRPFGLGTEFEALHFVLAHIPGGDSDTLLLWFPWDLYFSGTIEDILSAREDIKKHVHFAELILAFREEDLQRYGIAQGTAPFEFVLIDRRGDCSSVERYVCYSPGVAYGILRRFTLEEWRDSVRRSEIGRETLVVLREVPFLFDTPVAGVITAQPQILFAHVGLLARREGIPNVYIPGAWDDETFVRLDGKAVRFTAGPSGWKIEECPLEVVSRELSARRPLASAIKDPVDSKEILSLAEAAGSFPVERFGGKFAHLARLYEAIPPENRVPGFGIPFGWFRSFLEKNRSPVPGLNLWEYVLRINRDPRFIADRSYRRGVLARLRSIIRNRTYVDAELLDAVARKAEEVFGSTLVKLRFRSSSNAEDSVLFPGAGLYDSTSACPADSLDSDSQGPCLCDPLESKERSLGRALRKVWASLWNDRAWEERWWYGIPEEKIRMGILVSPAFLNERANGVALTGNPNDPNDRRFFISVQAGEASVVRPEPGVYPEVDILAPDGERGFTIVRAQRSSLVPDGYVLDEDVLIQLGHVLKSLADSHDSLPGLLRELVLWDVEFKVGSDGGLRIKQVRPFLPGGSQRLLRAADSLRFSLPGKVFVTLPTARNDIVRYHRNKITVRFAERELRLPPYPGGSIETWVANLTIGPGEKQIICTSQGEASLRFDISQWAGGYAFISCRLQQKAEDFNVEAESIEERVTIYGTYGGPGALSAESISVCSPEGKYTAICASNVRYRLQRVNFKGGPLDSLVILERVVGDFLRIPVWARIECAGRKVVVDDPARLSWTRALPPFREAYLVEPVTPPLPGIRAFAIKYRLGRTTPDLFSLGEDYGEIAVYPLAGWSSETLQEAGTAYFVRGDVDGDGVAGFGDVVTLLRSIFGGGGRLQCPDAADVTDDGVVNVSDAVALLRVLFDGGGTETQCAADRTPDELGDCTYPVGVCFGRHRNHED